MKKAVENTGSRATRDLSSELSNSSNLGSMLVNEFLDVGHIDFHFSDVFVRINQLLGDTVSVMRNNLPSFRGVEVILISIGTGGGIVRHREGVGSTSRMVLLWEAYKVAPIV